jgi:molecular chaperone DnaK (HSP70)
MSKRFSVGIDLGTTHTALAVTALGEGSEKGAPTSRVMPVPQLVGRAAFEARELLPSYLYLPPEGEGALSLPWDAERRFAVGAYARERAREAPTRVISSAKSWLSHTGVDRRAGILPQGAPPDIEKISPVEASYRYLDHLAEAWAAAHAHGDVPALAEQHIVLTVPASFDAAARELTVEAAYCAGMEDVTLLEEPQAALYAFIEAHGQSFNKLLAPGDVVLVVDVGGGTTDFSAIAVGEENGELTLTRVAVGDHILLGGDNMDLALAHVVSVKLRESGHELDRFQVMALAHACRAAKEELLSESPPESVPVVVPSRGSALVGGTISTKLTRDEVTNVIIEGFFPRVEATTRPTARPRAGLTQIGLPYAADAAITKHLAAFLGRQSHAADAVSGGSHGPSASLLRPTLLLFNGGVLKAPAIRQRLVSVLDGWLSAAGAPAVRVLEGADPDLAVARGAAYFGRLQQGEGGLRVRGGTAQAYYVGLESPMPAVPGFEPPLDALCVAPLGMEEGSEPVVLSHELGVVVGEPVTFRFFCSSVRRDDPVGAFISDVGRESDLIEVSPLEITFPAEGRVAGDVVPVRLRAHVTAIGTLKLEAVPLSPRVPDEAFAVELSVRGSA